MLPLVVKMSPLRLEIAVLPNRVSASIPPATSKSPSETSNTNCPSVLPVLGSTPIITSPSILKVLLSVSAPLRLNNAGPSFYLI